MNRARIALAVFVLVVLAGVALRPAASVRHQAATNLPPLPLGASTSADDMAKTLAAARARLMVNPADAPAAIALANVLLRTGRIENHGTHGAEAELVLKKVLDEEPGQYDAMKMLGAIYLNQHRFLEARQIGERAQAIQPRDPWNFGVIGDASIELGDYGRAFEAYDAMARLRPDAAAFARVAYAQELQGRLREALTLMQRAADATGPNDPEAQAWHYAQLGHLYEELGDLDSAYREYARGDFTFPGHPYALAGLARVAAARKDYRQALDLYQGLLGRAASPDIAAAAGDLLELTGDHAGAARMFARAESLERDGWKTSAPQYGALARMLAERNLKTDEALALATQAAGMRQDIFTMDALAWARYRAGKYVAAAEASHLARRTGTRDRRILAHAAAIDRALDGSK